jgi:hypothetical protein
MQQTPGKFMVLFILDVYICMYVYVRVCVEKRRNVRF